MRSCSVCYKRLEQDEKVWIVDRVDPASREPVQIECHACKIKRTVNQIKSLVGWRELNVGDVHRLVFKTRLSSDAGLQTFGVLIGALRKAAK